MIESIVRFSIKNRISVLVASLGVILLGIYQASQLSIDALPDVTNVQVSVVTKAPGLSPTEIEQFITYPIELALNGMPQVQQLRSISKTGVSSVTAIFKDHVDDYFARQLVNERLRQAQEEIPPGYGIPALSPITTGLGDIYELVLLSDRASPEQLRTYLEWELAPKLKAVPGVIDVNVFGGKLRQYQIIIDPVKLAAHNLSLNEILSALRATNYNVGGGYIQKGSEQWVIRGEGQIKNLEDLGNLSIRTTSGGVPLLLKQISDVRIGHALSFGNTTKAGIGEVVGMTIIMLKGQNSRDVVNRVKETIHELEKNLPNGMKVQSYYDRSEFIGRTLSTLLINLTEGAGLVILVLFFLLRNFNGAVLVATAIPFSMFFAVIFMQLFGIIGNLMSLGAIDFGLLVDGAIIMLEAVLTLMALKTKQDDKELCIEEGCIRVARAAAFSIGIILLVYLPLLSLEEVEGKMFRPMAVTMSLALAGAVLFSLTTFPAALVMFKKGLFHQHIQFWEDVKEKFNHFLDKFQSRPKKSLLLGLGIILLAVGGMQFLGTEFLPRIDEGEISIDVKRLPSTSIDYSEKLNEEIEKVLLGFPEVISVVSRMGRGESASEPRGMEEGEIMVKIRDKNEWTTAEDLDSLMIAMKAAILDRVPSSYISMSQPIEDRVNDLLAGSKSDVVVKIYGDDLNKLKEISEKVAQKLKPVPGTGDLKVQRLLGLPMLEIKINRAKIARYGANAEEVLTAVKSLRVGTEAGKVFEGLRRFDIVMRLNIDGTSIDAVENIPVMTMGGHTVPLGLVTDIQKTEGPAAIYREHLKRRVFVEVNIRNRDLGSYVLDAQEQVEEIAKSLPEGYELRWGGQYQNFIHAKDRLMVIVPIIMFVIFFMLALTFKSFKYAIAIASLLPLTLSGGIFSLLLRGMPFSIPSAVGFIALSGISVLTGIVYCNHLKNLIDSGTPLDQAIKEAATSSVRPIITTEVTAAIGFLPMALSQGVGSEVQRPLATVVIGGLFFGTILAQFLLPIVVKKLFTNSASLKDAVPSTQD